MTLAAKTTYDVAVAIGSVLVAAETYAVYGGREHCGAAIRIVVKGQHEPLCRGDILRLQGMWHNSSKYGRQFYADARLIRRLIPNARLTELWLTRFDGIGPERSKRIMAAFGGDLETAFGGATPTEELAAAIDPTKPHLAACIAAAIQQEWQEVRGEQKTLEWLESHGIEDLRASIQVARLLGPEAPSILERDPYVLAAVLPWTITDRIGKAILSQRFGGHRAPARLAGAVDSVFRDVVASGATAALKAAFEADVLRRLGITERGGAAATVIATALDRGALVDGGDRWIAPGCAIMEREVAERFDAMVGGLEVTRVRLPSDVDLRRMVAHAGRDSAPLHDEQREAVVRVLKAQFACLVGGAGTGKTTTCRSIVRTWELLGGRVELAALAGKAALRLAEGVGPRDGVPRVAYTVFKLLAGLRLRRDGRTHWGGEDDERPGRSSVPLPLLDGSTLLVLDEASMVDLGQMHQLLEVLPRGCRLLLVGDEFQLPPIGFGLVFHRYARQSAYAAKLRVVHRQSQASGIPAVSAALRDAAPVRIQAYNGPGEGVSLLEARPGMLDDAIERVVDEFGGFEVGRTALMVLSPINHRAARPDATVRSLNLRFHERNVARQAHRDGEFAAVRGYLGQRFAVGDPVAFTRNDYRLDLRNGSLGWVQAIDAAKASVTVDFEGRLIELAGSSLIDLALAYAITCHRAQGSQARRVVIALTDAPNVDPTWLYTAITRAQDQAVIVGKAKLLDQIMARPPAFETRLTGWVSRPIIVGDPRGTTLPTRQPVPEHSGGTPCGEHASATLDVAET